MIPEDHWLRDEYKKDYKKVVSFLSKELGWSWPQIAAEFITPGSIEERAKFLKRFLGHEGVGNALGMSKSKVRRLLNPEAAERHRIAERERYRRKAH